MSDPDQPNETAKRIATSVRDRLDAADNSRRNFLGKSAVVGGSLLALGAGTGATLAQNQEEDGFEPTFDDVDGTDVDVLNYALSLEQVEASFFDQGSQAFGQEDFMNAEALQNYDESVRGEIVGYVNSIGQQEATHVETLTQAIDLLGGEPPAAETTEFQFDSVDAMLGTAQQLENTAVAAYAGAAPYVQSPDLLRVLLSIHSVEARHAAFFSQLNVQPPAPNAFDEAMSQQAVMDAIGELSGGDGGQPPGGNETETPGPGGNETETPGPGGNETETPGPGGNETETPGPGGNETVTPGPGGNETLTPGPGGNETEAPGPGGNETSTPGPGTNETDVPTSLVRNLFQG